VLGYLPLLTAADVQYDCLVFDGKEHVRIASLPGMWDRTVTVLSAGSALYCLIYIVGYSFTSLQRRFRPLDGAWDG
jgi:hypothetical protein